jgi:Family of unknown function (DUF6174)
MAESGTSIRSLRGLALTVFVAIGGLAACGDIDEPAAGVPESTGTSAVTTPTEPSTNGPTSTVEPSTAATTTTTLPNSVYEAVTVATSQADTPPHDWWWVVDLTGGATIDGSGRVLVEIPQDEVRCGESMRHIDAFQLSEGTTVSFEVVEGAPGERPAYWYTENQSFESEPAVRGRQFRMECPPGTEEIAAELAAKRAMWEQAGVNSYEFTMRIDVFGPWYGEWRVVVVDDEPVSIMRTDESQPDATADFPGTIDSVFDILERSVTADSFIATYDADLGYPVSVVIDHYLNAVDDELAIHVTSLTPAAG